MIASTEGATLAWLVDPAPDALHLARAIAPSAKAVSWIADTGYDFDAAIIATPARDHEAHAADLIGHGKHVLVEKPAAFSAASAEALIHSAASAKVTLMAGHQLVYHAAFRALGKQVESGAVGHVREIIAVRTAPLDLDKEPGVIWSLGPHDLSMMATLLRTPPTKIECRYTPPGRPDKAVHAEISLGYECGDLGGAIDGRITLISRAEKKMRSLTIHGTEGALIFDDAGETATLTYVDTRATRVPLGVPELEIEALASECAHFVDAVHTGRAPLTGPSHIHAIASTLERCCITPS